MSSKAVLDYLTQQRDSSILADDWNQLTVLYSKKLWHQLTLFLYEFVPKLEFGKLAFYENVIQTFEERLNPISLVQIVLIILKECTDIDTQLLILQQLKEKVRMYPEAKCLCLSSLASLCLNKGCADDSKEKLVEAEEILEQNNLEVCFPMTSFRFNIQLVSREHECIIRLFDYRSSLFWKFLNSPC